MDYYFGNFFLYIEYGKKNKEILNGTVCVGLVLADEYKGDNCIAFRL